RLAARRLDALGDRFERLASPAGQEADRPLARERQRRRLADAAARSRHPGDLPLQLTHFAPLSCLRAAKAFGKPALEASGRRAWNNEFSAAAGRGYPALASAAAPSAA